ncbi:MAG: diguanylate cyclase [Lachnospiraceae bacterium]
MLMWDLDDLKYVNDNYGHEMRETAISVCSQIELKTLNRYGAVVERHSGDEFMAFLCGSSQEELTRYPL